MQAPFSRPFLYLIRALDRFCRGWENTPHARCARLPCGALIRLSFTLYAGDSGPDCMLSVFPSVVTLSAKAVSSIGSLRYKPNT